MRNYQLILLVLSSLLACRHGLAQGETDVFKMSLDELLKVKVFAATKTEAQVNEVPASISVITQQQIMRFGYRNVAEVLSHIAGFSSTNNLVYKDFGVRGSHAGVRAGSRIIKVLVNGRPIAFRSSGQNFLGDSLFSTAIVEQIEIIRGPVSTLYGANAFLGVVNIVTTQSPTFDNYRGNVQYQQYQRADNEAGLNISIHAQDENYQLLGDLNVTEKSRDGLSLPKISPESEQFYANEDNLHATSLKDQSQSLNLFLNWQYQFSEDASLDLQAMRQEINSDVAFYDLNPLRDSGYNRLHIINQQFSINHQIQINDEHELRSQLLWSDGAVGDDDRIELGARDHFLKRRTGFNAIDLQFELLSQWKTMGQTLIGIDHSDEDFQLETFYRVERSSGETTSLSPPESKPIDNTGLYFQWQKPLTEAFDFILGFRHDSGTISKQQDSFRLGLVWELDKNLSLKFLAGNSFQAPSTELLFRQAVQAGDIIGNQDLASQKARTYELVMDWKFHPNWHLNLTGFNTRVDDLVVYQTDFSNLFAQNKSGSDSNGFELELNYNQDGWLGYANFSFHQMNIEPSSNSLFILEHREKGEILPDKVVNLGVSYQTQDQSAVLSFEHQYNSERPASSQNVLIAQQFYVLDAYQNSDFFIKKNLPELFQQGDTNLQFKIRNLFDNQYVYPGFGGIDYPNLGRRYQLTLEWSF